MNPALSTAEMDDVRKGGVKRPVLYIAVLFCLGIASSNTFAIPLIYPLLLSAVLIALALIFSGKKAASHIYLYLAVFSFGVTCYQNSNILPRYHIANLASGAPKKVITEGVIVDDPITGKTFYNTEKATFVLRVIGFKDERPWQKSEGLIKVDVYGQRGRDLHFGDKVVLEGILSRPPALKNPGLFDYASYLRIKNIYSVLKVKELFIIKRVGKDSSNIVKRAAYVWQGGQENREGQRAFSNPILRRCVGR